MKRYLIRVKSEGEGFFENCEQCFFQERECKHITCYKNKDHYHYRELELAEGPDDVGACSLCIFPHPEDCKGKKRYTICGPVWNSYYKFKESE